MCFAAAAQPNGAYFQSGLRRFASNDGPKDVKLRIVPFAVTPEEAEGAHDTHTHTEKP